MTVDEVRAMRAEAETQIFGLLVQHGQRHNDDHVTLEVSRIVEADASGEPRSRADRVSVFSEADRDERQKLAAQIKNILLGLTGRTGLDLTRVKLIHRELPGKKLRWNLEAVRIDLAV